MRRLAHELWRVPLTVVATLVAVKLGGLGEGGPRQDEVQEVVRAKLFELVDQDGRRVAELHSPASGLAELQFYGVERGTPRGDLERPLLQLGLSITGKPELSMTNLENGSRFSAGVMGKPARPSLVLRSEPAGVKASWNDARAKLVVEEE